MGSDAASLLDPRAAHARSELHPVGPGTSAPRLHRHPSIGREHHPDALRRRVARPARIDTRRTSAPVMAMGDESSRRGPQSPTASAHRRPRAQQAPGRSSTSGRSSGRAIRSRPAMRRPRTRRTAIWMIPARSIATIQTSSHAPMLARRTPSAASTRTTSRRINSTSSPRRSPGKRAISGTRRAAAGRRPRLPWRLESRSRETAARIPLSIPFSTRGRASAPSPGPSITSPAAPNTRSRLAARTTSSRSASLRSPPTPRACTRERSSTRAKDRTDAVLAAPFRNRNNDALDARPHRPCSAHAHARNRCAHSSSRASGSAAPVRACRPMPAPTAPPAPSAAPRRRPRRPLARLPRPGAVRGDTTPDLRRCAHALPPPDLAPNPGYDVVGTPGARAVGLAPPGVNFSNFMDTRLSWTFGDDDFLHPTGQLIPLSPTFSIGDRTQYRLFFDSLNSCYAGRENLTHLVMYKKMPGFIPRLTTEAAVVLRFDLTAARGEQQQHQPGALRRGLVHPPLLPDGELGEGGPLGHVLPARHRPLPSRLPLRHQLGRHEREHQPVDLPGHPGLRARAQGPVRREELLRFLGFKTASIVQPEQILNPGGTNQVEVTNVAETNYGFLGGARRGRDEKLPLRHGRRLLPAGATEHRRRPRRPRLHVRRLRPRRHPPGHARAAVGRLPPLQERPERADDHVQAARNTTRTRSHGASAPRSTCSGSTSRTSTSRAR